MIVIVADTFRADHLGCYGNDSIKTPNLDKLGKNGVIFKNAYADGLPTINERRVFFTGKSIIPMSKHGGWTPLKKENTLFSKVLGNEGYTTGLIADTWHYFEPDMNFHKGFDMWQWIRGQETDPWRSGHREEFEPKEHMPDHLWNEDYDERIRQYLMNTQNIRHEEDYFCAQTFRQAGKWLERNRNNEPFTLWVDTFDPHEPWDAPKRFQEMYYDDYPCDRFLFGYGVDRNDIKEEDLPALRGLYSAEVSFVDMWIGDFLDRIENLGLMDNTIIVFTSDHGTHLGEDGYVQKQPPAPLNSRVANLPLIVRHPEGPKSGREIDSLVSSVDFMPTFLNFLDVEKDLGMDGENFWNLATGETDSIHDRVFTEYGNLAAVRDPKWHYFQREREETARGLAPCLYNLESDPDERQNVYRDYPDIAQEKRKILEKRLGRSLPD